MATTVVVSSTSPPTVTVSESVAPTVTITESAAPTVTATQSVAPTVSVSSTSPVFTQTDARASISATGSVAYNSTTGVISYTHSEPTHGLNDLSDVATSGLGLNTYLKYNGVSAWVPDVVEISHVNGLQAALDAKKNKETMGITIDGGGSVITTGVKGWRRIPYACTVQQINLICDVSGNLSVTIRTRASGAISGTSATTDIIAVSSAQTAVITSSFDDATIAADDMFEFEVTGTPATVTRATVMVELAES